MALPAVHISLRLVLQKQSQQFISAGRKSLQREAVKCKQLGSRRLLAIAKFALTTLLVICLVTRSAGLTHSAGQCQFVVSWTFRHMHCDLQRQSDPCMQAAVGQPHTLLESADSDIVTRTQPDDVVSW